MVRFTSARERWLWCWTAVLVVTIYATLGVASTLASWLQGSGLLVLAFALSMILVAVTVLTQGLRVRPGGIELGAAIGIGVVYLLVFVRMGIPERSHLIEYGVVAVFIYEALTERAAGGGRVPVPAILAMVATSTIGAIDEGIQAFLPSRHFEWTDIVFNILASVMAVTGMVVLGWALRWGKRLLHR